MSHLVSVRSSARTLVDNERVLVVEFVLPPVDELAYVIDGEFAVVTRGHGKRVARRGEVEWAREASCTTR